MHELRSRLSRLALPAYAVDAPGGGGKIVLTESTVVRTEDDWYVVTGQDGNEYRYPVEI
jgi:lysine 2,3-aminomutase